MAVDTVEVAFPSGSPEAIPLIKDPFPNIGLREREQTKAADEREVVKLISDPRHHHSFVSCLEQVHRCVCGWLLLLLREMLREPGNQIPIRCQAISGEHNPGAGGREGGFTRWVLISCCFKGTLATAAGKRRSERARQRERESYSNVLCSLFDDDDRFVVAFVACACFCCCCFCMTHREVGGVECGVPRIPLLQLHTHVRPTPSFVG